jgi:O-antigen/teichoic acid export membrane protein
LTVKEYGKYSIVVAIVSIIIFPSFQWVRVSILRFYDSKEIDRNELINSALVVTRYVALFISIVLFTYYTFGGFELYDLGYSLLLLCVIIVHGFKLEVSRASQNVKEYGFLWAGRSVLFFCFGVLFLKVFSLSGYSLVISLVLSYFFTSLFFGSKKITRIFFCNSQKEIVRKIKSFGLPISLGLISEQVITNIDRIFLEHYVGLDAVGSYSAGYDLVWQVILMTSMAVNSAAMPIIIKEFENERIDSIKKKIKSIMMMLIIGATIIAFGYYFLGEYVISKLLNGEYLETALKIAPFILMSGGLFALKITVFDIKFYLLEKTKISGFIALSSMILNVILNLILIPKFGVLGAVYSTLVSYFNMAVVSYLLSRRLSLN